MVEFCLEHGLVVANTLFQKSPEHLVAYLSGGVSQWGHPFHFHKYAQLDFMLVNSRWKNSILNVSSTYVHALDTDHRLLKTDVKFKLKAKTPPQPVNTLKFHTPSLAQSSHYNTIVAQVVANRSRPDDEVQLTFDELNFIVLHSASTGLPCRHPAQKSYIPAATWSLLKKKWEAVESQDWEAARTLDRNITVQVRQDRESHLLRQREELDHSGYRWDG